MDTLKGKIATILCFLISCFNFGDSKTCLALSCANTFNDNKVISKIENEIRSFINGLGLSIGIIFYNIFINYFNAAMPGNSFPSKYSNIAPPPVLT